MIHAALCSHTGHNAKIVTYDVNHDCVDEYHEPWIVAIECCGEPVVIEERYTFRPGERVTYMGRSGDQYHAQDLVGMTGSVIAHYPGDEEINPTTEVQWDDVTRSEVHSWMLAPSGEKPKNDLGRVFV